MPFYDYECAECGHTFETFQNMSDDALTDCPACSKDRLRRLVSGGVGVIFKGSGFYVNDSRASAGKAAAPAASAEAASGNSAGGNASAAAQGAGAASGGPGSTSTAESGASSGKSDGKSDSSKPAKSA